VEISTDVRFIDILSHLATKFNAKIKTKNHRIVLKLNGIDEVKVFDTIANQIVTTMKSWHIAKHIALKDPQLIEVLTRYDQKTDLILASTLLEITPVMNLDSLYDFRLFQLKKRWDEVVSLVNDNVRHLACKGMYAEFLRFLIENI
jgi:hypothetical protein